MSDKDTALKLMRKPFEAHQISKMCKPTKKDNPPGKCNKCGGFHKLPAVQLSYVGHAALTDRLLDADPEWTWEPLSYAADGTPFLDKDGGLWIKLTVAGVTRMGYGDAQGKVGGDAMKERIGDALRNAAMRFGAALELWHRGDLHGPEEEETFEKQPDGSFAKSSPNSPPSEPVKRGRKPNTETAQKLPAKSTSFDFGHNSPTTPAQGSPAQTTAAPVSNAITPDNPITDSDLPDNLQGTRLPTEAELKDLRDRLIKFKDKGHTGIGTWIIKRSGKPRTNDVPLSDLVKLVEEVERADSEGKLKELLAS